MDKITNETEFETALERVSELMSAKPSTPEGDELEALSRMMEVYDKETEAPIAISREEFQEFASGCLFTSWRRKPYTWEELDTFREWAVAINDSSETAASS